VSAISTEDQIRDILRGEIVAAVQQAQLNLLERLDAKELTSAPLAVAIVLEEIAKVMNRYASDFREAAASGDVQ
jgi:hypothetical protein